jgi:hypothetical protein
VNGIGKLRAGAASALWASIVMVGWLACSSESPRPAALGGCTPVGDAGCSNAVTGGGSGSGPGGEAGGASDGASGESAAGCGEILVTTTTGNQTCGSCLEANCCLANAACSDLGSCLTLEECTLACGNSATCVSNCFTGTTSAAQSAYDDLSACLSSTVNGCTGCTALPLQSGADF